MFYSLAVLCRVAGTGRTFGCIRERLNQCCREEEEVG